MDHRRTGGQHFWRGFSEVQHASESQVFQCPSGESRCGFISWQRCEGGAGSLAALPLLTLGVGCRNHHKCQTHLLKSSRVEWRVAACYSCLLL